MLFSVVWLKIASKGHIILCYSGSVELTIPDSFFVVWCIAIFNGCKLHFHWETLCLWIRAAIAAAVFPSLLHGEAFSLLCLFWTWLASTLEKYFLMQTKRKDRMCIPERIEPYEHCRELRFPFAYLRYNLWRLLYQYAWKHTPLSPASQFLLVIAVYLNLQNCDVSFYSWDVEQLIGVELRVQI